MSEIVPVSKTPLKVFIASAAEVKEERDECVQILNRLHKAHEHLYIEPVLWEYDMPHSNYPGHTNIQDAITKSELKDCPIVVFIFFSKIGKYTKEEFEYATKNNKRLFVYFKDGFSPVIESIETYSELLKFQHSLNDTVLYEKYKDLTDFERQLYINLNLYFSQTYLPVAAQGGTQQDILAKLEEAEKARKELEQQLATQTQNNALKALAQEEIKKGDYAAAEEHLKQSAKDSIADAASTFYELGKIKNLQLLYKESYDYYELAAKIEPQNDDYLYTCGQMADTLGLYDDSMAYHQKTLTICIAKYGEEDNRVAPIYNDIGLAYNRKGDSDKAIEYFEKAIAIGKKFHGEEHPNIAPRYNNLGAAYDDKGEYDKAIEYYEKAIAIGKKFHGEEHPDIAIYYNNLGSAYNKKGEYDKAIEYYEKALAIAKKFHGEEHPKIAIRYNNLGAAYRAKGEYDKTIQYYEQALTIDKKFYGEEHLAVATDYNNFGFVYYHKNNYKKAITYYQLALPIFKKFLPINHPSIQTVENNLQAALAAQATAQK